MKKTETISTICRMCDHGRGIEVGVAEDQSVSLKGAKGGRSGGGGRR